ncbi:MAG: hydrogenase expression/formation protein HypE [Chitinivibrionales bacterium]|nr:hydrogenase expression/formation protein HypE [Chitinivibrionales bacterium]
MTIDRIELSHGSGKGLQELLGEIIFPVLASDHTGAFEDAAVISPGCGKIAFTTDSFVVNPLEFPGGDIGKLAACGTINDLAMMGAVPTHLAVSLILEEDLDAGLLRKILKSLKDMCALTNVAISCGDTKVVEKGKADGIFITTAGIGSVHEGINLSAGFARKNDTIIISGPVGLHGIAILAQRKNLGFASSAVSDCAPLHEPALALLEAVPETRVMRDATRGGCATVLNEIAADSGVTIRLKKTDIPVPQVVESACAFLGFDPLQIANEGTFAAVVPSDMAQKALEALYSCPQSKNAAIIGKVENKGRFPLVLETEVGGTRPVEIPPGRLLPRIC